MRVWRYSVMTKFLKLYEGGFDFYVYIFSLIFVHIMIPSQKKHRFETYTYLLLYFFCSNIEKTSFFFCYIEVYVDWYMRYTSSQLLCNFIRLKNDCLTFFSLFSWAKKTHTCTCSACTYIFAFVFCLVIWAVRLNNARAYRSRIMWCSRSFCLWLKTHTRHHSCATWT